MGNSELKKMICAGIVTYNPEIERLSLCLNSVINQVSKIIIFDNGSVNIEEIERVTTNESNVEIIRNSKNSGIATALARIMDRANIYGYKWVLSMDQDSILQQGMIEAYTLAIPRLPDAGMLTCLIKDRNFSDEKYENQDKEFTEIEYCITSGALTNVDIYIKTEGYDESFFIDCVDFDLCYTFREHGFKIYRINYAGLLHEVGCGENRRFFGKKIVVYHEKPWRIFYLARNIRRMGKKHKKLYPWYVVFKKELALFTRIIFFEDSKEEKLKEFRKGISQT